MIGYGLRQPRPISRGAYQQHSPEPLPIPAANGLAEPAASELPVLHGSEK